MIDDLRLSLITPAFNEAANLPVARTHRAAMASSERRGVGQVANTRARAVCGDQSRASDGRVRGSLRAHCGSHRRLRGLHEAEGDAAAMIAADLQDPPETLAAMLERWRAGAQVVWAVRRDQPGERGHAGFAAVYYWIMRHVVGMKEMPAKGADFFLADRVVVDAFRRHPDATSACWR